LYEPQEISGLGSTPKEVQELGHTDVSTTMNIYAHATNEAKSSSAKLLDKVTVMSKNTHREQKISLVSVRKGKNKGKYIRMGCLTTKKSN